ncbi:MAG: ABC transporter permease [Alkalispirochaetaceae bacterium]
MIAKPRFSRFVFWATILFLFMPLAVLVLYSFNGSRTMAWGGASLRWYAELFGDSEELWRAFANSVLIAFASAGTATVIATAGAIGISWYASRIRNYVQALSFLPLVLPEIIVGVSLLVFFAGVGLRLGLVTIYLAHTSFNLPFVLLIVLARLEEFDVSILEAARDLGANEWQTLMRVIVPLTMPGILSGFLTAFTLSLEDFVITFFVSGPGSTTLPLYVYSMIRFGVSPVINALSVVIIAATVVLALLARRFTRYIIR